MAALTLRLVKGSPLTNAELDANFSNLDADVASRLLASSNLADLTNAGTARTNLGLGNVENKSSSTIRSEITSSNVTTALGFTPYDATNPSGYITSSALTPYLTTATAASTYQPLLGFTPLSRAADTMIGLLGLGNTSSPLAYADIRGNKAPTSGTTLDGFSSAFTASDVTTANATSFTSFIGPGTGVALTNLTHFAAAQRTFSGTATTQTGFEAAASMTGATTNYGFRGRIASGTNRWNLYMDGTADNYLAGRLGIGSTVLNNENLRIGSGITGAVSVQSILVDGAVQSDATTRASYYRTVANTQAAAFTLTNLYHYEATQNATFGAGSTVTTQVGFRADSTMTGAGTNIGFRGAIPAGANRWNLFMDGAASNFIGGNLIINAPLGFGTSSSPSYGSAGQVLTSAGPGAVPTWSTPSGGVLSFNTRTGAVTLSSSDVTTALGFTPGDVTLAGAQTLTNKTLGASSTWNGNVIGVAYGGTGLNSLTANGVLLGNGTSAVQTVAPGASGNVLTSNGTTWVSQPAGGSSLTGRTSNDPPGVTALGVNAGVNDALGSYNTYLGNSAGQTSYQGNNNTILGYQSGYTNYGGSQNTFVGTEAGYTANTSNNTAVGYRASYGTTGGSNVAVGDRALSASSGSGSFNVAVGEQSLAANTSAGSNVSVGSSAMLFNTTGGFNVAVGAQALRANTTAAGNVAVGYHAMRTNTTGATNTATGNAALRSNSTGNDNAAFGYWALYSSTASSNTAVGAYAGFSVSSGAQNTLVGHQAGNTGTNNLTTGSNNTLIGYRAQASSDAVSNEITLGNASIATLRCQVTTITSLSDARDKTNVVDLDAGLALVNAVRPVCFDWHTRDGAKVGVPDTGFIAQELQAAQEAVGVVIPGLVYSNNPERLEAGYGKLLPVMVRAIQELSAKIDALQSEVRLLKGV